MKFYDKLTGNTIDRLVESKVYKDACSAHAFCTDCPLPNGSHPEIFAELGLERMYCSDFRDSYPELAAPFYQCEVIYEPCDVGYVEETLDVDDAEVFGLLGF